METSRFDALLRQVVQADSRRHMLGLLGSSVLGGVLATSLGEEAGARKHKKHKKKGKCKNCGACQVCQKGTCKTAPDGTACGAGGRMCQNGGCGCPAGQRDCGGSCAACCPGDECCDDADCADGDICTTDRCQNGTCVHAPDVGADCGAVSHAPNSTCQANGTCAISCTNDTVCQMVNSACICQPDATGSGNHCRVIVGSCEGRQPCTSTAGCPRGQLCQSPPSCNQNVCVDACAAGLTPQRQ
jgi:hypothetical protein